MSKQTSIEWLIEQLEPAIALQSKHIDKIEKEAIEMHARDMIDFITWIGGSYSFGNVLGLWYMIRKLELITNVFLTFVFFLKTQEILETHTGMNFQTSSRINSLRRIGFIFWMMTTLFIPSGMSP